MYSKTIATSTAKCFFQPCAHMCAHNYHVHTCVHMGQDDHFLWMSQLLWGLFLILTMGQSCFFELNSINMDVHTPMCTPSKHAYTIHSFCQNHCFRSIRQMFWVWFDVWKQGQSCVFDEKQKEKNSHVQVFFTCKKVQVFCLFFFKGRKLKGTSLWWSVVIGLWRGKRQYLWFVLYAMGHFA